MPVARKLRIRPLKASEVTFTVEVQPECLEVRGNVMASDDTEFDKQCEDEILERLDRGDIEAWCCVVVKATWEGIEGFASLGGCSYEPGSGRHVDKQVEETVSGHGLRDEALESLNQEVELQARRFHDIVNRLRFVPKR